MYRSLTNTTIAAHEHVDITYDARSCLLIWLNLIMNNSTDRNNGRKRRQSNIEYNDTHPLSGSSLDFHRSQQSTMYQYRSISDTCKSIFQTTIVDFLFLDVDYLVNNPWMDFMPYNQNVQLICWLFSVESFEMIFEKSRKRYLLFWSFDILLLV